MYNFKDFENEKWYHAEIADINIFIKYNSRYNNINSVGYTEIIKNGVHSKSQSFIINHELLDKFKPAVYEYFLAELIKAAQNIGIMKGAKVTWNAQEVEVINEYITYYDEDLHQLWIDNAMVYDNGHWIAVIPSTTDTAVRMASPAIAYEDLKNMLRYAQTFDQANKDLVRLSNALYYMEEQEARCKKLEAKLENYEKFKDLARDLVKDLLDK
jgi:hypothetical protein